MSELSVDIIQKKETQENEKDTVNDNKNNDSSINESQDFHLIADDETQEINMVNDNNDKINNDEIIGKIKEKHEADGKPVDDERYSDKNTEDKVVIEAENTTDDFEKIQKIQDNEEIVQCTPEEIFTPRKRLIVGTESHKRKADDEDDAHAVKYQRTSSREDALASVRKKLESEDSEKPGATEAAVDASSSASPEVSQEAAKPAEASPEPPKTQTQKPEIEENPQNSSESPKSPKIAKSPKSSTLEASSPSEKSAIDPSTVAEKMEIDAPSSDTSKPDLPSKKSRMSIEVIYDKALAPPPKPKELVEIDEDGEKIVLDSSQEEPTPIDTSYKTCDSKSATDSYKSVQSAKESDENPLSNGSSSKKDFDSTVSVTSEQNETSATSGDSKTNCPTPNAKKPPEILNLISDSEGDSFTTDEKTKAKIIPVEKELNVVVKLKCLLQVNESTKEVIGKEFLAVDFENLMEMGMMRRRNSDASALADVSDNKDPTSPGSVTSNPHPYPLNPSRLSIMSLASTSSSSSSGSSKLLKDTTHFPLPRGLPKHAKKATDDEAGDKLKKEWKNVSLLTSGILTFVNAEILSLDLHNGTTEDTLERLASSTPEAQKEVATPKSSKKGRVVKRTRVNSRSSRTNGVAKLSPNLLASMQEVKNESENNDSLLSEVSTPSRQSARSLSILRNQTPVYDPSDALVGKECFAKWSDNNYYPGKVIGKSKGKFKVNFLDGKNKLLIEDFVVEMPKPLGNGLSVYATTPDDGYGSCGIITEVQKMKDDVLYTVETDEGEKIKVPIKDIFMTSDQVQLLREIGRGEGKSSPSTPSMGKVTLDNVVEGTRRTKSTSAASGTSGTPKSRGKGRKGGEEPSASGISRGLIKEPSGSESNYSAGDSEVEGIQAEVVETPNELAPKGPANRVKGKGRNRKKSEDQEIVKILGPIPEAGSTLFKGMSFLLTCAPLESLDRYKAEKRESANSETETENEAEWNRVAFVRERLTSQLTAGGGVVYEEFKDIPVEEYKNTKLITNVPNITAKSLLCLSVNIPPVNHRWVIRCCKENKVINTSEESLPAGWSFDRDSYVDMFQRPNTRPLGHAVVVIPKIPSNERSIDFWQRVVINAGGAVRIIENQSETFIEGTVVLASEKCPSWIKEKAAEWKIPLVTTTWLIQSLIEGKMMAYDAHPLYQHNYNKLKD